MNDQIAEIMETAMLKETASATLYHRAAEQTDDPGAAALLRELVEAEEDHLRRLKNLDPTAFIASSAASEKQLAALKDSPHLQAPDELPGAGLPDTLRFAIKQEAQSAAFYRNLASVFSDEQARQLTLALAAQEVRHQDRLSVLYDNTVLGEN